MSDTNASVTLYPCSSWVESRVQDLGHRTLSLSR